MGWLRSVGSIKLHVSFAEYGLLYRSLLQKKHIILSILLTKATPYPMTVSTENAALLKSAKSSDLDSSVSRGTNSN